MLDNYIDDSEGRGKGLYAGKQYEHGDVVEFNTYKSIELRQLNQVDDYIRKRIYCDRYDIRYPSGNLIYVNHDKYYNCDVMFNKEYILLIANQTIRKGIEITINYGENNIDF